MNIDPQGEHTVRRVTPQTEEDLARWIPLTDEQAAGLAGKTREERHAWIKANVPTKERLSRHLRWIGLPFLAAKAAAGEYSDFEGQHALPKLVLVRDLDAALRRARRKKGEHSDKAMRIGGLRRLVVNGEYDDTRAESEAWASQQTGEVREILDLFDAARGEEVDGGE